MEIEVDWSELKNYVVELEDCHKRLQTEYNHVADCMTALDSSFQTASYSIIAKFLKSVNEELDTYGWFVWNLSDTLNTIIDQYTKCEAEVSDFRAEMLEAINVGTNETASVYTDYGNAKIDVIKLFSELIKQINEASALNILSPAVKFINELTNFYEGLLMNETDFADWCKVTSSGGSFWSAFYKYFEKKGVQFGSNMTVAAGTVSVLGAWFGLVGGIYDASEKGTAGAYIKATGKGFDVGKAIAKVAGYKVSFNGGWFTLGGTIFSTGGQFVDSFQKYSADGTYDFADFNDTMFDSSIAGLSALLKGLTGGIVDIDSNAMIQNVREWGKDVGTSIGNRINNNPEMKEKFSNGNFFEKMYAFTWGIFA